jgi:hypothetical protein
MATKRGRKSAASLATAAPVVERPAPPDYLTQEQAEEWRAVVERMPADWFSRETHALLAQYARHVVNARQVARQIELLLADQVRMSGPFGVDAYDKLLRLHEREGRAMSSIATRLRLTQQARYTAKTAGTAAKDGKAGKKPWQA